MEQSFCRIFPDVSLEAGSTKRLIIEVDWAQLDDPDLKRLLISLVNLRPHGIRPSKRFTGKSAAVPFYKLKQLAAWRLSSKARFSYTKAQQVISDRKEGFPKDSTNESELKVYPEYTSAGAWSDAVAAGKKFVIRGC